jgi:hypothetical protein
MNTAFKRISARNVHERLALRGPRDELRNLADTVDGLLERLDSAFDAQKRFVANAAHEPRAPLTLSTHCWRRASCIEIPTPHPCDQSWGGCSTSANSRDAAGIAVFLLMFPSAYGDCVDTGSMPIVLVTAASLDRA